MANGKWTRVTEPSPGLVQDHYVAARLEELKARNPALEEQLAKVLVEHPLLEHLKLKKDKTGRKWLEVYRGINTALQQKSLTINFKAEAWFTTENNYDSYTQMYERAAAAAKGKLVLMSDALNPARVRARVDDAVTFPKAWTPGAQAPARPGLPAPRGLKPSLTPGLQSGQRIQNRMAFGQQSPILEKQQGPWDDAPVDTEVGVASNNPYYNPKTKQVFAALNYGMRPHGSSTRYGMCFLKLKLALNTSAFYFGGDTFFSKQQNTSVQMPFQMLAGVLANSHPKLVNDVITSCYFGRSLPDAVGFVAEDLLLEGHLFSALPFTGNITHVCLPEQYRGTVIGANAATFALKHGAEITYTA